MSDAYDSVKSHGSWLQFNGSPAQRVTSLKFSQSCSSIDMTGINSREHQRIVRMGDLSAPEITVTTIGSQAFGNGATGPLVLGFGSSVFYEFPWAFVSNADIDASTGELIKASYTFTASPD